MAIKTNGFKMPNGDVHTFIPPSPTENERGGIKAKHKTTESLEVAFDETTERLYAATPDTDKTLSEANVAADAKTTGDKIETKLDKNQGKENVGKALVIGGDGNVVPGEVQSSGGDGVAIVNTLSGASPLVIPDSAERVNKGFGLTGKTDQMQTTGKNLFGGKILAGKYPTNDMNIYEDKPTTNIFDKPVEIKPDTEYIISADGRLVEGNIYIYDESGKKIAEHYSGKFTSSSNAKYVVASGSNTYMTVNSAVQMEYGSTITPYEPYTGGKPSPSPEYPQEIKSVGKWDEEKQKYEVGVKMLGKNLFDPSVQITEGKWIRSDGEIVDGANAGLTDYIPIEQGKYAFHFEIANPNPMYIAGCDKDKNLVKIVGTISKGKSVFSIDDKKINYIRVSIIKESTKFQLEISDFCTEYEPYKEQTLTITSDRPITKWDKLVEQDGQIGWLYGSAINEYRGDTIVAIYENGFYFLLNNKKLKSGEGYCEELKQYVVREGKPSIAFNMSPNTYAYTLNTQAIYGSTVSAIKEYLKTHPLHLVYKTETTEFIPLPRSEQNAIRAMTTYYPSTTLINDQGCTMELDYVADPKNFILGQIGNLQKSLVNTQVQLL